MQASKGPSVTSSCASLPWLPCWLTHIQGVTWLKCGVERHGIHTRCACPALLACFAHNLQPHGVHTYTRHTINTRNSSIMFVAGECLCNDLQDIVRPNLVLTSRWALRGFRHNETNILVRQKSIASSLRQFLKSLITCCKLQGSANSRLCSSRLVPPCILTHNAHKAECIALYCTVCPLMYKHCLSTGPLPAPPLYRPFGKLGYTISLLSFLPAQVVISAAHGLSNHWP